jgi:hypothetical protein
MKPLATKNATKQNHGLRKSCHIFFFPAVKRPRQINSYFMPNADLDTNIIWSVGKRRLKPDTTSISSSAAACDREQEQ